MQAPTYTPDTDFSQDEADNVGGRATVRTPELDAELSAISQSINALTANAELNQRDDGEIRDHRVKLHTLATDVLALLTTYGATPRGAWVTAAVYALKDLVSQGGNTYIAVSAHTSGTFATDLAAGKWLLFSLGTTVGASSVTFVPTATVSATNAQAAVEEVDSDLRALVTAANAALATLIADLADSSSTAKGDALVAVKLTDTGAAATTQHAVNEAEPRNPKLHFGSPWDNVTTSAVGLQNAVNAALSGRGEVFLPAGDILIDAGIELNDQSASGFYRKSVRVYGAGKNRTRLLHRVSVADSVHGKALFQHKLVQTQGDNNYFAQGLEIAHLEIYGDSSSSADCVAISLQGAYYPWLHDMQVQGMKGHGIQTPADARWPGVSDRYSCADVVCERVNVLSCTKWGIFNQAFATAWKIRDCHIISNVGGGVYLEGSVHEIGGGAVAGNGASGDANSGGIVIVRTSDGTPQNVWLHDCEIDSNWINQIRTSGTFGRFHNNRIIDDAGGTAFRAPVQVLIQAVSGASADSNRVDNNSFRYTTQGSANVANVKINLDVADGSRTVRYNTVEGNTHTATGATSGVVTSYDPGSNPSSVHAVGNKHYSLTSPRGKRLQGTFTKNIADASGTQTITGVGFKPSKIRIEALLNAAVSFGEVDGLPSTATGQGVYYYPTGAIWATTTLITIRTAVGDIYDGAISSVNDDGFVISWTKTGTPTGSATIKWYAEN